MNQRAIGNAQFAGYRATCRTTLQPQDDQRGFGLIDQKRLACTIAPGDGSGGKLAQGFAQPFPLLGAGAELQKPPASASGYYVVMGFAW